MTPPNLNNSDVGGGDWLDDLILDIAQQASLIPRGKTISADVFPAKAAIEAKLKEEVREARKDIYFRLAKHLDVYDWSADEKDSILQAVFEVVEGLDKSHPSQAKKGNSR